MVTKRDLEVAIAAYGLGRILPAGSTRAAVRAVIPQVVRAGKVIAPTAGRTAATLAAANPVSTGLGLGLAATQTPSGQALLDAAAERGAADRVRAQQLLDQFIFEQVTQPTQQAMDIFESPTVRGAIKSKAKRKVSKYQKAVKAGMKAVKSSKFNGKKGTVSNAKKAFAAVNKVASAVNKGKKVSNKGVTGTIARAVRKVLPKKRSTRKTIKSPSIKGRVRVNQ
tara:strand:+ start:672 stop:1343 length:672 start_codon:yes stop_codon:yes gene_type:complete